jgi:hypothetical protein
VLKPGTLCWLVRVPPPSTAWNGRVVSVLAPYRRCFWCGGDRYEIECKWLDCNIIAHRKNLLPFNDPTPAAPGAIPTPVEIEKLPAKIDAGDVLPEKTGVGSSVRSEMKTSPF